MGTPRFTPEFKEESVRQITERGIQWQRCLTGWGGSAHSLYKWLRAIKPDNSEQHARDLLEAKSEILKLLHHSRRSCSTFSTIRSNTTSLGQAAPIMRKTTTRVALVASNMGQSAVYLI